MTKRTLTALFFVSLLFFLFVSRSTTLAQANTIIVDTNLDELNSNGNCSLREAIETHEKRQQVDNCTLGTTNDVITFNLSANPTIVLTSDLTTNLDGKRLTDSLTIDASSIGGLTINGANAYKIFFVDNNATVVLQKLTLIGARAFNYVTPEDTYGPALFNNG